jgi:hypothetical protein
MFDRAYQLADPETLGHQHSSACLKQVSRLVLFRVPAASALGPQQPGQMTSSRGTSSMARYAITWGPRRGWILWKRTLYRGPTYLPATVLRRVAPSSRRSC